MRKLIGVLLSVVLMLTYAGVCSAQDVTGEIVTEGNEWVKRKVEVVRTEMGRYAAPPFQVPDKDKSTVFTIMEAGQGEYEMNQSIRAERKWDFPMQSKKYKVKTVAVFQDGVWSDPKLETMGPEIMENDWFLTALLAILAVGVLITSMIHQRSGKSDWCLLVFYGMLAIIVGNIFIDNSIYITLSIAFAIVSFFTFAIVASGITFVFAFASSIFSFAFAFVIRVTTSANQQVEYAVFMVCVILVSYLLAKIAKRLGWIKVVEKPVTSA